MLSTPLQSRNQTTVDAVEAHDFSSFKEGKGGSLSSQDVGFCILREERNLRELAVAVKKEVGIKKITDQLKQNKVAALKCLFELARQSKKKLNTFLERYTFVVEMEN